MVITIPTLLPCSRLQSAEHPVIEFSSSLFAPTKNQNSSAHSFAASCFSYISNDLTTFGDINSWSSITGFAVNGFPDQTPELVAKKRVAEFKSRRHFREKQFAEPIRGPRLVRDWGRGVVRHVKQFPSLLWYGHKYPEPFH